jgi:flagellar assembly protein FliH
MAKKIFKGDEVLSKNLKSFNLEIYKDVERGEKVHNLEKVADVEYTPGEISPSVESFDEDVKMGRAVIVQESKNLSTKNFTPKSFDQQQLEEPQPEEVSEEVVEEEAEPEPAISEEELEAIRKEAYEKGLMDGLDKGRKEGEQKAHKNYEADKNAYIAKLEQTYSQVIESVKQFDSVVGDIDASLPDIIISMVKDIVGTERRVNDKIVTSVAKKSMEHLRELEKVIFIVHPDDKEHMQEAFPDYVTEADPNMEKGSLRVSTNIGEMNFCIERMLEEFVDKINEEFSQTEEG